MTETNHSPKSTSSAASSSRISRRVSESSNDGTSRTLKEQHHFPFKLYNMLEYAADSQYSSAVSWSEDGRAFAIHSRETFLENIVPMFFKQTKFRSFTRQLNLWGFVRVPDDPNETWQNEHFIRGRVERLGSIQRVEVKNNKPKTKTRQPKNIKPIKRRTTRTPKGRRTMARVSSPADLSDSSLSTESPFVSMEPPYATTSKSCHETALGRKCYHACDAPRQQPLYVVSTSCYVPVEIQSSSFNSSNMNTSQSIMPCYANDTDRAQHYAQPIVGETNEEDFNCMLSGIFESEESSNDDDLSSMLSWDDVYEDFVNPISF